MPASKAMSDQSAVGSAMTPVGPVNAANLIGKHYQAVFGSGVVYVEVKSSSQVLWSRGTAIYTYKIDDHTLTIQEYLPTGRLRDIISLAISPDLTSLTTQIDGQAVTLTTAALPTNSPAQPNDPIAAMQVKGKSFVGTVGSTSVSIQFNNDATATLVINGESKRATYSQDINSVNVMVANISGNYEHYRTFMVAENAAMLFGSEDGTDANLQATSPQQ